MNRRNSWPPRQLALIEGQLEKLRDAVQDGSHRDIDDQVWITRFLVVRTSGYLEQVVHETVSTHLENAAGGRARSFIMSWFERSHNPSESNMLRTLGRLDPLLRDELEQLLSANDDRLRDCVLELVAKRNRIAHGANEGITSQRAIKLVDAATEVANWFILRLDPFTPTSKRIRESAL